MYQELERHYKNNKTGTRMLQFISAQSMYQELSDITNNNKIGGQCYIPEQSMYQELERQYKKQ